ncbi:WD repeat protein iqw1 [Favolaschia claudopus]|uniref:WD repeat protein iqw1 n=1 Tax=Favolaschia claudopus TaxID=2862362 RepID=A0AAW0EC54_9AGAR
MTAFITATQNARAHRRLLSHRWASNWDRVNVLGDDASYGHSGCVNALSWARDGELLLSGGDDRTVQIWRMDTTVEQDFPFVCRAVIQTGHLANIFNVEVLPYSSNIATVAGDGQVRVHEMGEIGHSGPPIATEDSPYQFLTVAEDGTVRQHDLRINHQCDDDPCPTPLIKLDFELSALSLSPLTPFQFVVAGESPYQGYLFDRRQVGRFLLEERGMVENGLTYCTRRLGRPPGTTTSDGIREHITGARVSHNGYEVFLTYHADGVYLYNTRDDPEEETQATSSTNSSTEPPPAKRLRRDSGTDEMEFDDMDRDIDDNASYDDPGLDLFNGLDEYISRLGGDEYSNVPLILPRQRYSGARNVSTIKDGKCSPNFLGPEDEFVTSGSDCGNVFIWKKDGTLHSILEGDSSIVNVIEGHPHLPLFAASGIDTTVKVIGLTGESRVFPNARCRAHNCGEWYQAAKLHQGAKSSLPACLCPLKSLWHTPYHSCGGKILPPFWLQFPIVTTRMNAITSRIPVPSVVYIVDSCCTLPKI